MKKYIQYAIEKFIRNYEENTVTKWGSPIVGFADAKTISEQMSILMPGHGLPEQAISDAKIVVAYFVPFLKSMTQTNRAEGLASEEWAIAYEETNEMLGKINEYLIEVLNEKGYKAAVHPESGNFDRENLISNWSHRHIAYLAGLGTFGINNMLITEKGCCGRYSTIVTDLDVMADSPMDEELCRYKNNGSCGACMKKCPSGALTPEGFDRHKCYEICMKNAAVYTEFGNSYALDEKVGSEVCGKCIAGMPCAFL